MSFSWYPQRQQSFEELKKRIATRPIIALLSGNRGFVAYTNASRRGLGNVLMQMGRYRLHTKTIVISRNKSFNK